MSNILSVPVSGAIYFSSGVAGSSTIPSLASSVALQYDNAAGMNITSYNIGASATNRFSVDGANGRLFSVSDSLTGVIFSVNDAAGLPIIDVSSNATDVIKLGTYGTNALVVNDTKVGIGTATPAAKLDIVDTTLAGSGGLSGSILNLTQTWNTSATPTAIKLNVTDTASNASSLLMDLRVGGATKFNIAKNGITNMYSALGVTGTIGATGIIGFTNANPTGNIDIAFQRVNGSLLRITQDQQGISGSLAAGSFNVGETDTILSRKAAASLRLGAADAAAPVPQTFGVQSVSTGTSNISGASFTIAGSQGTGTGAGGSIIFQVAPAGSSGTAQNGLSAALTIASDRTSTFSGGAIITGANNYISFPTYGTTSYGSGLNIANYYNQLGIFSGSTINFHFQTGNGGGITITNPSSTYNIASDVYLGRKGAANWRLGLPDAAAPVSQILSVQSVVAGTTNTVGANLTITGSQGTGTGAGGSIIFQTAPAGSAGTAQNGLSAALTIASTGGVTIGNTTDTVDKLGLLTINDFRTPLLIINANNSSGNLFGTSLRSNGGEVAYYKVSSGSGEVRLWASSGGYYYTIYTNNVERLRIDTSGNVGIGTATPNEKLTVSGNISATGTLSLGTALAIAQGGTGGTSASTAITNLGIGTGVENSVLTESTSARTLGLTDAGKYIRFTSLSAITVTVPTDAVSDFPIASIVYLRRASTGVISLSTTGITVNDNTSTAVPTGGVFALKKIASNTWDFI